jgi:hypothetical protein
VPSSSVEGVKEELVSACGWSKKTIDIVEEASNCFRFLLSRERTTSSKLYLDKSLKGLSLDEVSKLEHVEVYPQVVELTKNIITTK